MANYRVGNSNACAVLPISCPAAMFCVRHKNAATARSCLIVRFVAAMAEILALLPQLAVVLVVEYEKLVIVARRDA